MGRDSISKRLGVKIQDGQPVMRGQIIIRQRGTKYSPGANIKRAEDDTLFAMANGKVKFSTKRKIGFDGRRKIATVVSVV